MAAQGRKNSSFRDALQQWLKYVLVGAVYGLMARLTFSDAEAGRYLDSLFMVMTFAYIVVVPVVIGYLTIAPLKKAGAISWKTAIFLPMGSVLLCCLGAFLAGLEGSICIAMGLPLMLPLSSLGGIIAKWEVVRDSRTTLSGIAALPLLVAVVEGTMYNGPGETNFSTHRTIEVNAAPSQVWQQLMSPGEIGENELRPAIINRIGVPTPQAAFRIEQNGKEGRVVHWQRGVQFKEFASGTIENQYIRWDLQIDPSSFPKGTMDEHVVVGGRYFDVSSVSYDLRPTSTGTALGITINYRVDTNFNAYSQPLIGFLLSDFSDSLLEFYKSRVEHQPQLALAS